MANHPKRFLRRDARRLSCEPLEPRLVLTGDLCITEFMASNNGSSIDSFGESSDWIELYNGSSVAIDLSQYSLTDDVLDLDKYALPSVSLAPSSTILVRASNRNLVTAGGEIHANFSLSAAGEYLALVDASEVVVQDFGSAYPPQFEDTSYGVEMFTTGPPATLLGAGAASRLLIPTEDIGLGWTGPAFDDSSWSNAVLPIGYENTSGYQNLINTTVPNTVTTAYVRIPFSLSSLDETGDLTLRVRYDDGFVAYLNGVKVEDFNAPDTLTWESGAEDNHDDGLAVTYVPFDVSAYQSLLQVGQNVLAVHALNLAGGSSDFLFEPILEGTQTGISQPIETGYLATASPGASNGAAFDGFVDDVAFSLQHGFFNTSQTLALATPTAGATIVYTTDGSNPTVDGNLNPTNGTVYAVPISVNQTTIVRAAAFKANQVPSIARAQSYLFTGDIIHQSANNQPPVGWPANGSSTLNGQYMDYGMDPVILSQYGAAAVEDALTSISTISINTDLANLFDQQDGLYSNAQNRGRGTEKFTSVELVEPDGSPGFQVNAGLRIRGGYSRNDWFAKHNLRLFFRSEYGDAKLEYDLYGEGGAKDFDILDLRSAQNYSWGEGYSTQVTLIRELFGRDTQADMGHPRTHSSYHHLYMNGIYWGVYQTQERVEAYFAESYLGGNEADFDRVKADNSNGLQVHFPDGNNAAWQETFNLTQALGSNPTANADNYWTVQGLNSDGTRNPALPVLLDMDNLVDYMMVIFYTGGTDTGLTNWSNQTVANNWVAVRNRVTNDQGWQFFIHDNEHSLGITRNPVHQDRTGPFNNGNQDSYEFSNPAFMHQDLMKHAEYRLKFQDRVQRQFFNDGALTLSENLERWNEREATVDDAIIAHAARWGDRWDEDFSGDAPFNKQTWLNEVNWITGTYMPQRNSIVLNQLRNDDLHSTIAPAIFDQWGGVVSNGFGAILTTTSGGMIYYTTDGTDPRRAGGAVRASAQEYSAAVSVTGNLSLKARVRLANGNWSALTEADFRLPAAPADATNLRITEINYHPSAPTPLELSQVPSATTGSFEFIEFENTGSVDIDLTGVQIQSPLSFSFPSATLAPGERALLVRSQAAFAARYSSAIPTIGEYGDANGLSDNGDLITVVAADGDTIQSFSYDDNDNWPSWADGVGNTLQVIDVAGDYHNALNWLPSRAAFGTPGFDGTPLASSSALRITELHYNPTVGGAEFVEIYNDSATPVNLSGVRLVEGVSFDFNDSTISVLQPGAFALVVSDVTEFNSAYGPGLPVAGQFAVGSLSNGGERVILFDAGGNAIHDFVYDDVSPWDSSADGGGKSLEVVATSGNYSSASNWQSSSVTGGTPGLSSGNLSCDFVGGGNGCDIADLDALYAGTNGAPAPLTDALINQWLIAASAAVNSLKSDPADMYVLGDANLDGDVNSTDLGLLLNSFGNNNGLGWGSGNLNSDAVVSSTDLGIVLNNFGYNSVSVAATLASEPTPALRRSGRVPRAPLPVTRASVVQNNEGMEDAVNSGRALTEFSWNAPKSERAPVVPAAEFSLRELVFGRYAEEEEET